MSTRDVVNSVEKVQALDNLCVVLISMSYLFCFKNVVSFFTDNLCSYSNIYFNIFVSIVFSQYQNCDEEFYTETYISVVKFVYRWCALILQK